MKREWSNRIRWAMEDIVPPIIRDSRFFAWLMAKAYGSLVYDLAEFRQRAHALTAEEYAAIYRRLPRVHEETDNSAQVLEAIADQVLSGKIADIGCGTGYTIHWLSEKLGTESNQFTAVDFQIDPAIAQKWPQINFVEHAIESLPFDDNAFDTVICTHTLEHILDIRTAIAELRRITAKRLIIVVPREREAIHTFNPHFHFFPYLHSFLRMMIPVPNPHECRDIGRDIFYVETKPFHSDAK